MQKGIDANPQWAALISMHQHPGHLAQLVGSGPVQSPAIRGPDEILTWSYAQMRRGAARLATIMARHHVPPESAMVTFIAHSAEWILLLWASALARLAVLNRSPDEPKKGPEQLRAYFPILAPALVVVEDEAAAQVVDQVRGDAADQPFLGISLAPLSTPRRGWVSMDEIARTPFTESESSVDAAAVHDRPDRLARLFFTSGTIGPPKGVPRTVKNICAGAAALWSGRAASVPPPVAVLLGGNFASMTGTMPINFASLGGTIVLSSPRLSWADIIQAIETCRVSVLALMRDHVSLLSTHGSFSPDKVKSLRRVFVSGEIVTQAFLDKAQPLFPNAAVLPVFGMTEALSVIGWPTGIPNPPPSYLGAVSCGMAMPGARIKIVDENGNIAACGEQGELHIGGDAVIEQYWGDQGDLSVFYEDGSGSWFRTGDIAMLDEGAGKCLYVVGRMKDRVKSLADFLPPFVVESCIRTHFGIEVSLPNLPVEIERC
jgi:acyl-CoA synthetase (AMP-forming)/AMP-acid ligase II